MMTRRSMIARFSSALALAPAGASAAADEGALLTEAFVFGLPILEMAATRQRALAAGAAFNRWGHRSSLADARSRSVTTPNNDTLYSSCWLDLASPVTLTLPPQAGRYQSIALMDAYTNVFHIAHAGDGPVRVVGPDLSAKRRDGDIRAPTPMVWALARTYVADPADLASAKAAQHELGIEAQQADPERVAALLAQPEPPRSAVLAALARMETLIAENPPARRDGAFLRRLLAAGFGVGGDRGGMRAVDVADRLQAALAGLRSGVDGGLERGWIIPPPQLGRYGGDYRLRAATALAGLGALPPSEARYMIGRNDQNGEGLTGQRAYSLTLEAGAWPPGAFWSLTLYEKTPEGQLYFHDNELDRYALGPGKPGFEGHPDRPVTLTLARDPPVSSSTNWLPAPKGPFEVQLRVYRPKETWRPPPIVQSAR